MIKINLLLRKKEKRIGMRKEIVVALVSILLFVILLAFVHWQKMNEKDRMAKEIAKTRQEITDYQAQIAEAKKAKEEQQALQEKLDVINALRKEKSSSAKVLDEVSSLKPEKMWLESFKKDGPRLGIEGIALDDETVANFMTNLRKSSLFKSVDLVVSERSEQSKIMLKKFTLSCEIVAK
ncbi:MAG: PilN domain-containing protein [Desulfobacterales bacterium]|jgi:type IV pilus assembly protein PilN|nr:PilN domain-containing protein [Desulfobacterales bacterium]